MEKRKTASIGWTTRRCRSPAIWSIMESIPNRMMDRRGELSVKGRNRKSQNPKNEL